MKTIARLILFATLAGCSSPERPRDAEQVQHDPPGAPAVDQVDVVVEPEVESAPRELAGFVALDWLVLRPVDARGRRPLRPDAVLRDHLLKSDAEPPLAGMIVRGEVDSANWNQLRASEDGTLAGERFAWAYTSVEHEEAGVWMANLQGANTLYVNGEAFQGDVYRYGFGGVPVLLKAGVNHIYVNGNRGGFTLRFDEPATEQFFADWDRTLPDVAGPFAVVEVNASTDWSPTGDPPLSVSKRALDTSDHAGESGSVQGFGAPFGVLSEVPDAKYVTTFISEIDGSVQSMGVSPPTGADLSDAGLVLSLHGASVPVRNQLGAHSRHEDFWIFVPTNRRPYGFDWQDWGRQDAYEVLERGISMSGVSRDLLYLLGHSMGGHGTWHLAANDPDTWAAIQPSAGWCSFDTYGSRPNGELAELWQDADGASRTLDMIENLTWIPTLVVHGDADETVPADESRAMLNAIAEFDRERSGEADLARHFEAGAGHWWDGDGSRGADCLEYDGLRFFDEHRSRRDPWIALSRPTESSRTSAYGPVGWVTADPSIDSAHAWIGVEQVIRQGEAARVESGWSHREQENGNSIRLFNITTTNVRLLKVDTTDMKDIAAFGVLIGEGGTFLPYHEPGTHWFERRGEQWVERGAPNSAIEKTPARGGNFKRAFDKHFFAVVGTAGDDESDAALLARARHDAQQWWYRGNGRFDTWTDSALESKKVDPNRNRILYGNADSNSAWTSSLPVDCPVIVENGRVQIGDREWKGDDLVCLFTYPLAGSDECVVGAFGFTGPEGARIAASFGTFVSGAGFPDLVLVDSSVLTKGDGGVLAAGWFENDWTWAGGRIERGGELVEVGEQAESDDR
jgi:dienelactone hydrolase